MNVVIWRNQTCDYFSLATKSTREISPVPSLINIACGGCTLLNLALHLSKFARADRHCHVRRMTVTGPCALWGIAEHQARRRWVCQGAGLTAWTLLLFFPNSELQFPSPTGSSLASLLSSTAGDLHRGWPPRVLIFSHFSTCSGDAILTTGSPLPTQRLCFGSTGGVDSKNT